VNELRWTDVLRAAALQRARYADRSISRAAQKDACFA